MRTTKDQVQSVFESVAKSLRGIDRPVLARVLPILRHAHDEVERELRTWRAKQNGTDTFTAQRHRNVLVNLKGAFRTLDGAGAEMAAALKDATDDIGALSLRNLQREWREFSHIFEGTAQPLPIDEAITLAHGDKLLWPQFETSSARYAANIGERTQFHLAVSRARAETIDELTTRLEKHLPDVFRANRWDAERLARTETMSAYNTVHEEGIREAHEEDPGIMSRWDASYDFRRCPMCASLDGQVIDVSKGEKFVAKWFTVSKKGGARSHVRVIDGVLAHPNCRCTQTPWRASWAAYSRNRRQVSEAAIAA